MQQHRVALCLDAILASGGAGFKIAELLLDGAGMEAGLQGEGRKSGSRREKAGEGQAQERTLEGRERMREGEKAWRAKKRMSDVEKEDVRETRIS